ncbi:MAG: hypothetical protein Q9214_007031, partial [Letrouitia sp. 1 TL-2023]
ITVYDAVAGRVSSSGFIPKVLKTSRYRDTLSSSTLPIPPEEVLFRQRNAPERFQEDDIYWANEDLVQPLPDSDLLKAIHTYASDFYNLATTTKGLADFSSMDETALIACGILLEEFAVHVLGATGDLAFVEGQRRSAHHAAMTNSSLPPRETPSMSDTEENMVPRKKRKTSHVQSEDS